MISFIPASKIEVAYEVLGSTIPTMFWILEIFLPILIASLLRMNPPFFLRQARLADLQSPPAMRWDVGLLAALTLQRW
jgi:hypothetical protein